MARLEDLTRGAAIRGILPDGLVTVVDIHWYGTSAIELTYKDAAGRPGNQLLYRDDEARLEVVCAGRPWSFDADGGLLRLVWTTKRIKEKLGDRLRRRCAEVGHPELYDKIADETVCTELEPLIEHLAAVGHPALELGDMI